MLSSCCRADNTLESEALDGVSHRGGEPVDDRLLQVEESEAVVARLDWLSERETRGCDERATAAAAPSLVDERCACDLFCFFSMARALGTMSTSNLMPPMLRSRGPRLVIA